MNFEELHKFIEIKHICEKILKEPENEDNVNNLSVILEQISGKNLQHIHQIIFCSFFSIFKKVAENKQSVKQNLKISVIQSLNILFNKTKLERIDCFLNIYGFLLNEIYDSKIKNCVAIVNEEYKLQVLQCIISLFNCLSWDLITKLYTNEHAPKLCQIVYVATEIAKTEKLRKLKITAIKCVTTVARVEEINPEDDIVLQSQVADVFVFFLPGISSSLRDIALKDEKLGHAVVVEAIKAFGKLICLVMYDHNNFMEESRSVDLTFISSKGSCEGDKIMEDKSLNKKWTNEKQVKDYLENLKRDVKWFKETDTKLQFIIKALSKLVNHSHPKVREELAEFSFRILKNCSKTMVFSMGYITEILIILSEDEYDFVSLKSKEALLVLSDKFLSVSHKSLQENLEEKFYEMVTDLPRIFNTLDEHQQLSASNMLVGYLRIFNENGLIHILYSSAHLQRLIVALINITKMETNDLTQLEDFIQDAFSEENNVGNILPNFKKFRFIQSQKVVKKLETACSLLAVKDVAEIVIDSLMSIIQNNGDEVKEAIYLLNEVLLGLKDDNRTDIFQNVISLYLDSDFWDLSLYTIDNYGTKLSLGEVQNNILQICLLVEGFGKIATNLGPDVRNFLLKIMFPILERAGSPQPIVRRVGLETLKKLSLACGHNSITDLINANSDYFSYHVKRKIQKIEKNESVLNVLCVVMEHSNIEVLQSISHIIEGILLQTCDKYFQEKKANPYLYVFKTFVISLIKWLDIKSLANSIKPKEEIENHESQQHFQVSDVQKIDDFSDEIMHKTAEEMFQEDLQKSEKELLEEHEEEYKKPEPPTYVKLTVLLLKRCLHFLPNKDRQTRLLVLEILNNGLEIIKDWDDELLPIVHQIWSPLVNRFNEKEEHVVVNYSFELLVKLARLSKWFIRSRTSKEIMPRILDILQNLAKESYLKDKGSPYRYTQAFKLQIKILDNIARLSIDLEMSDEEIEKIVKAVVLYLSDKQPIPLQELCLKFFKELIIYDKKLLSNIIRKISEDLVAPEYNKNKTILEMQL